MSSGTKSLIGVLTFIPVLGIIAFFVLYVQFIVDLSENTSYYGNDTLPDSFWSFIVVLVVTILFSLGLTVYYCIHASRNKSLSSDMRLAWILINVFGGTIGHVIYFFTQVAKDRPLHPSNM